jgi:hypothetical protein
LFFQPSIRRRCAPAPDRPALPAAPASGGVTRLGGVQTSTPRSPQLVLEREVLRAALQHADLLPDAWRDVTPEEFTAPASRTLFEAIRAAPRGDLAAILDRLTTTETQLTIPLAGNTAAENAQILALAGVANYAGPISLIPGVENPGFEHLVGLAQQDGYVSQNVYTLDPNSYGVNGAIGAIPGVLDAGFNISAEFPTSELQSSQYWDGTQFVDNPTC